MGIFLVYLTVYLIGIPIAGRIAYKVEMLPKDSSMAIAVLWPMLVPFVFIVFIVSRDWFEFILIGKSKRENDRPLRILWWAKNKS